MLSEHRRNSNIEYTQPYLSTNNTNQEDQKNIVRKSIIYPSIVEILGDAPTALPKKEQNNTQVLKKFDKFLTNPLSDMLSAHRRNSTIEYTQPYISTINTNQEDSKNILRKSAIYPSIVEILEEPSKKEQTQKTCSQLGQYNENSTFTQFGKRKASLQIIAPRIIDQKKTYKYCDSFQNLQSIFENSKSEKINDNSIPSNTDLFLNKSARINPKEQQERNDILTVPLLETSNHLSPILENQKKTKQISPLKTRSSLASLKECLLDTLDDNHIDVMNEQPLKSISRGDQMKCQIFDKSLKGSLTLNTNIAQNMASFPRFCSGSGKSRQQSVMSLKSEINQYNSSRISQYSKNEFVKTLQSPKETFFYDKNNIFTRNKFYQAPQCLFFEDNPTRRTEENSIFHSTLDSQQDKRIKKTSLHTMRLKLFKDQHNSLKTKKLNKVSKISLSPSPRFEILVNTNFQSFGIAKK